MQKKYPNAAQLWRSLRAYPSPELYQIFAGQCYVSGYTHARYLEDILKDHFKTYSASERDFLKRKYEEFTLKDLIDRWPVYRKKLSHEQVHFLYTKIKYRKVMRLNTGFNENDYNWQVMFKIFDAVFTVNEQSDLAPVMFKMNSDLQMYVYELFDEVKKIKENKL